MQKCRMFPHNDIMSPSLPFSSRRFRAVRTRAEKLRLPGGADGHGQEEPRVGAQAAPQVVEAHGQRHLRAAPRALGSSAAGDPKDPPHAWNLLEIESKAKTTGRGCWPHFSFC